jgi:hypothetical protein
MAVTITTKFYETDSPAWHDLSKVVFTSPHMDSPNTAGIRSHVLPGQGDLGLWYEDVSNMYRVNTTQSGTETQTDYMHCLATLVENFDFSSPPAYVTVSGVSITQVRNDTGADLDYLDVGDAAWLDANCTFAARYNNSTASDARLTSAVNTGWYVYTDDPEWIEDNCWLEIKFDAGPVRISKVYFKPYFYNDGQDRYVTIKDYKIQAKYSDTDTYIDLYTGATSATGEAVNATFANSNVYQYYRIHMTSYHASGGANDGFGMCNLLLSDYDNVSDGPYLKRFYNSSRNRIIYVDNVDIISKDNPHVKLKVNSVSSTTSGTLSIGDMINSWGYDTHTDVDLSTLNSVVFEVTNGEAYNCRLTAWDDVTHLTTANEIIAGNHCRVSACVYNCKGSKLEPEYNEEYENFVVWPDHNRIYKGDTASCYFGDFDVEYREDADIYGDYIIFRPMLYDIGPTISYGVHDFVICLHYSYT